VNTTVQDHSVTRKTVVVTLDPAETAAEHAATVAEFARMAKIPGFRPGKAPAAVVLGRFGKDVNEEFKQKVMAKAYRDGLEQAKLNVVNLVDAKPGEIASSKPAEIQFVVDLRPDFALPEYVGLPTTIEPTEVTDAEVDAVVERLRGERADFKTADRPSQKGDYVKLAYKGQAGGRPIVEIVPERQIYGEIPQTWEEVEGSGEGLIPGLGNRLAGLKAGEKRDVEIVFPAEYPAAPALAGLTATYAVDVLEVRERVLPEIDEEFLKANRADTLEALRSNIRTRVTQEKEYRNLTEQRRQVCEAVISRVEFELPTSLVERETQSVLRRFIEENVRRGVPMEQFEKDKKALYENARVTAANTVKGRLILLAIAEQEKISVVDSDISAWIYRESVRSGTSADQLVKQLGRDRDRLRAVQETIIFDKTVEFLISKATVATKA
jgi:trigger factor